MCVTYLPNNTDGIEELRVAEKIVRDGPSIGRQQISSDDLDSVKSTIV